jgi:16S rRNA (guanine527-N7)-methyltransferase
MTAETDRLIEEGLTHYDIVHSDDTVIGLSRFLEELCKWNKSINLVGFRTPEAIVKELFYDAFFLTSRVRHLSSVLDLGSGSGVVAILFSLLASAQSVFSVEKSLKKVQFQRHVKRLLGLEVLQILHARAEDLPPLRLEGVVAKAFAPVPEVLDQVHKHLREGGHVFIPTGKTAGPIETPEFALEESLFYRLFRGDKEYQLFVYKKIS